MTRVLYVDAIGGVAGDMLLGALIDAGADVETVREGLASLRIDGLDIELGSAVRHGITAARVEVVAPAEAHVHRSWSDIRAILADSGLPAGARARAERIFAALARAEGAVHGVPPEDVHFHEVGGIDAIGDVCGIALALEALEIDEIVCSSLPMPHGFVTAAHGRLPLPAPATLELLRGAAVHGVDIDVELVTPTGAAVVGALARDFGVMPAMRLDAVGYGAGARDLDARPNVVRVAIGIRAGADRGLGGTRSAALLEANLDDLPGQFVPEAVDACFAAGALDAWVTPTQMKKGRPGIVLAALARPGVEAQVAETILRETTTLGVRVSSVERWELDRGERLVDVDGHAISIKQGYFEGRVINTWPEYEDCRRVAMATGRPLKAVWMDAVAAGIEQRP